MTTHPNYRDPPQGSFVNWSEGSPDQVEIIVWRGYSSGTGEYYGTLARFIVDREVKTIRLAHVSIKRPYATWNDFLTNPQSFVTDTMKRAVRAFMTAETGSRYWRVLK